MDINTRTIFLTEGARKIFEIEDRKVLRSKDEGLFCTESEIPLISDFVHQAMHQEAGFQREHQIVSKTSGGAKWVRITSSLFDFESANHSMIFGSVQDISDLKAAEQSVKIQKEQIDLMLENTPAMIYQFEKLADGTFQFPYLSRKAFEIYDIDEATFDGDPNQFFSRIHPDDLGAMMSAIEMSAESLDVYEVSARIITSNNTIKWLKAKSIPRKTETGSILWSGILIDITKDKEREETLRAQQEQIFHQSKLASI